MMAALFRSISQPIRTDADWKLLWLGPDKGLIKCWETGLQDAKREDKKQLADAALLGELPVASWKGGVSRRLKKLEKYGTLQYLAYWQGLRYQDLCIDPEAEVTISCTKTGMKVTFTPDLSKLSNQTQDDDANGDAENGGSLPGI
ncbi:MAG: hypothetical protein CVV07_07280 [Gammaproteobacteria bacterium HGW-Gammaproteobacteria-11]|nr:MAG: hypothetical protein CVV07_07280 [Gammaproteobacteria bacterium HGW-Gammaproteobacteria-11]